MDSISNSNLGISLEDIVRDVNLGSPYLEGTIYIYDAVSQLIDEICSYDYDKVSRWVCSERRNNSKISFQFIENMRIVTHIGLNRFEGCVASTSAISDVDKNKASELIIYRFGYSQLAKYIGINYAGKINSFDSYKERITPVVGPDRIVLQGKELLISESIEFVNYAGIVDFRAISYVIGEEYVLVPFTLYEKKIKNEIKKFFAPGLPSSKCKLFNAFELNNVKNKNVILFENLRIAFNLQSIIKTISDNNEYKYIITSHYGGIDSVENVDFSCLSGQNVCIVPCLSKNSYEKIELYINKCIEAKVNDVKFSFTPVLEFPLSESFIDVDSIFDPFVCHIANFSCYWKELEIFDLLEKITNFSGDLSEYQRWARSMMLIKKPSSENREEISSIVRNMGELVKTPVHEISSSEFSLDRVLAPKKLTQIVGHSNSGKTMFVSSLLAAASDGSDVFMFSHNTSRKILLVDVETGESDLRKIYKQCSQIIQNNGKSLKNIDYISLIESQDEYDFDITSSSTQSDLMKLIINNHYDLIVIDNLQSLDSNLSVSQTEWKKLYEYSKKIAALGVCVLILHHTPDGDKTKPFGIARLSQSFQTIMVLEGPQSFKKEKKKNKEYANAFIKTYINDPGTLIRLSFIKCKPDPRLEKKTFQYHLPFVDIDKFNAKCWIADPANPNHEYMINENHKFYNQSMEVEVSNLGTSEKLESIFANDEFEDHCVMVLKYAKDNLYFNGAQIQRRFYWSKRYVRKILESLLDSKKLFYTGKTSNRRYCFRKY